MRAAHGRKPQVAVGGRGFSKYLRGLKFTRIYADAAGVSHFADVTVDLQDSGEIGKLSDPMAGHGVIFRETEPTYNYDWHRPPQKQWPPGSPC